MNTVAERKRLSGILEIIVLKVVYGRIVPQRMIVENLTYVVFLTNAWTAVVLVVLRTRIAMSVYLTNMSVARRPFLSTKLSVAMIVSVKLVSQMTTALEEENAVVRTNALTHATKGLLGPRKTQPPPHKTKAPSTNPSSRVHLQGELLVLQ
jgi:hypothetical protein